MTQMFLWILLYSAPVFVEVDKSELELNIKQLEIYEDKRRELEFEEISASSFQVKFKKNLNFRPQDYNTSSVYWVKVSLDLTQNPKSYLLEFFDQTIDSLDIYIKTSRDTAFAQYHLGDMYDFQEKPFRHKNFQIQLDPKTFYTCYFRVTSHEYADIRVAIRSMERFVFYSLSEYFLYGILYGMIVIISLYNLLIFSAIKEIKYLYYTFYLLSVGVFAMSVDGIAFQYLWPNSPEWNQISHGVFLFSIIFWSILFSKKFLNLSRYAPVVNHILTGLLIVRCVWFLICLLVDHSFFQYRNLELIPLTLIFIGSIIVYRKGFKPARFFIVATGVLFIGFLMKALIMLSILPFSTPSYYSLHICFVFEMLFLSFALSDRVRILKANRDKAYKRIIQQHEETSRLKDDMNQKLEEEVKQRTIELIDKNDLLQRQKVEISEINSLLDLDNWRLRNNIKSIQRERLLNKELTYEEFKEVFTSRDDCYEPLIKLKWKEGFKCTKCANGSHSPITAPNIRRCSKCGYQESATTNTLFHNLKFPIEKAFYILYDALHEDQFSLTVLSEMLDIRKNTIGDFKKKIRSLTDKERLEIGEIFNNLPERVVVEKNLLN